MKPRVMSLVIFTCAVGLLTAPNLVSTKDAIIGILLVSLGAGAAGATAAFHLANFGKKVTLLEKSSNKNKVFKRQ